MKFYIGADHNGYHLKEQVENHLRGLGHEVVDEGDEKLNPEDDFTVYATKVVSGMLADEDHSARGILICGSGQGMVMAANRHIGIRAGLGWSKLAAEEMRSDEDSNVLALPAEVLTEESDWKDIVDTWVSTPFEGAQRYRRRIQQLDEM